MVDRDYEKMLHDLVFASVQERRRARRWRIFFLFIFFIYLTPVFMLVLDMDSSNKGDGSTQHTALVKLSGLIGSDENASADAMIAGLQAAFSNENTQGVILEINSPGGSPVQASNIYDEMIRLRKKHDTIPLYVVVSDMAASGGYYTAAAADKIFVSRSSLVGSIGVRFDSFGYVDLIKQVGIERRLLTAGENKGLLDPFLPENKRQKEYMQQLLNEIHQHFIEDVKAGRGDRLTGQQDLFSGLIWTGDKAIELGLADGYGTTQSVARDIVEAENLVDFTTEPEWFERVSRSFGAALMHQLQQGFNMQIR